MAEKRRGGHDSTTRRRALRHLGTVVGGVALASIAVAADPSGAVAADPPPPRGAVRPLTGHPELLPPGVKARAARVAGSCAPQAEYVGTNVCVDGFCCASRLYRQQCLDDSGTLYYNYFCV